MIYSTFHRGGTLLLVATPLSLGGGAHERHDQRGDARHHRPGVPCGYHHRLCGRDESQHRRRLRDAVGADDGRPDADRVGCGTPDRMDGWHGKCGAGRGAHTATCARVPVEGVSQPQCGRGQLANIAVVDRYNRLFHRINWRRAAASQYAAVARRLPLEARGISYAARKGAVGV